MADKKSPAQQTDGKYPVRLRVYDLSGGMARQMSKAFLGKQVDGIWHTGVVVHGQEFFFGGGIQSLPPETVTASFGISPVQDIVLGYTNVDLDTIRAFLMGVSPRFTQATYDLFRHNCNNFSDELCKFLIGKGIPEHIINLPNEVLKTPLGQMLAPVVTQMQNSMYGSLPGGASDPFSALGAARGAAPAPSAVPAPTVAPPAEVTTPSRVAAVPASSIIPTHARALVSADTSILKTVVDRLVKRGALSEEEVPLARAACAKMASGSNQGSKTEEPAYVCEGDVCRLVAPALVPDDPFVPVLVRLMKATDKTIGPALCLARAAVLDSAFVAPLAKEGTALSTMISNLADGTYATVTPRLMALATIANLFATDDGVAFLNGDNLSRSLEAGLQALGSDQRKQLRQLGAALLHNAALRLPVSSDSLSDDLVQMLCALCDSFTEETDEETARRRLLGVGIVVKRAGLKAAELLSAIGCVEGLKHAQTNGAFPAETRALASEIVELVEAELTISSASVAATPGDDDELD